MAAFALTRRPLSFYLSAMSVLILVSRAWSVSFIYIRLISLIPLIISDSPMSPSPSWLVDSILKLTIDIFIMSSSKSVLKEEFRVLSIFFGVSFVVNCTLRCDYILDWDSIDSSKTFASRDLSIDLSMDLSIFDKTGEESLAEEISSARVCSTTVVVACSWTTFVT